MNITPYNIEPIPLRFDSGHTYCAANFYRPADHGSFPVVVMAHGLGGVQCMRLPAFAERFVAAGYVCLTFDYRNFGESGGAPRQLLNIDSQLEDWQAAISYVRTRPDVVPSKVILWGTSFGGGHVLTTAANTQNIAAVISQCPFTDGLASSLAVNPVTSMKLTALAVKDRIGAMLGRPPVMVPLVGHSGDTALMTAPDAYSGYLGLLPQGVHCESDIAARFSLDIIRYFPGHQTARIKAPVLFCVCDPDTVAPAKATLRHAKKTPRKEIKRYPYGHFDIYVGEAFEHVVRDQIDFLQRTVPTTPLSSKVQELSK